MYRALDIFFIVFHTVFIGFVLVAWIWRRTRRAHLIAVVLTAFSWFFLGIWFGFGYCFCTDWHWRVRQHLGDHDMPVSYIKFLIDGATGWDVNATLVDTITVAALAAAFAVSVWVNARDLNRK